MKIKRIMMVVLGTFLCAIAFNIFMVPYNILSGGVSGISIIIDKIYPINKSIFILISSIVLLILNYLCLGKQSTFRSALGSIMFPIFVSLTESVIVTNHLYISDMLLSSVFGGILTGIGLGLVYKEGYTTGGTDIVINIISHYLHLSIGTTRIFVEGTILLVGTFIFGFDILMYSIITVYLSSIIVDRVILGISQSKAFYIITKKQDEVSEYIMNTLGHGVTILEGIGAFSKKEQDVLLTVIPTNVYYKLKEGLRLIDKDAFFVVCDSYEVGGGR